jgi:membrane protein YdbS with pleckstrin-like domain
MKAIVFLLLGFIPPLVAGPLAGMAYLEILKRRKGWYQVPFWVLLVSLDLLVMLWVATASNVWLSISSLATFAVTPGVCFVTVLVMRNAWRKLEAASGAIPASKGWFTAGRVIIPALQLGTFLVLLFIGPVLCKTGLVVCRDLLGLFSLLFA